MTAICSQHQPAWHHHMFADGRKHGMLEVLSHSNWYQCPSWWALSEAIEMVTGSFENEERQADNQAGGHCMKQLKWSRDHLKMKKDR